MALHVRRQIVQAVAAVLRRDISGVSVQDGRAAPMPVAKCPYLLVYARSEEVRAIAGRSLDDDERLRRALQLEVQITVADATDSDDRLDAFAVLIEKALAADRRLGGLVEDLALERSELAASFDGEQRVARARLEYRVEYHTTALRPDQHLE